MAAYVGLSGTRYVTGRLLGKGGEAAVHEVSGQPDLAIKIYHTGKAKDRREKITAMVQAALHTKTSNIAFPHDIVHDEQGNFAGLDLLP